MKSKVNDIKFKVNDRVQVMYSGGMEKGTITNICKDNIANDYLNPIWITSYWVKFDNYNLTLDYQDFHLTLIDSKLTIEEKKLLAELVMEKIIADHRNQRDVNPLHDLYNKLKNS